MFRKLVSEKKNIISYIVSLFMFLGNVGIGGNPFSAAMFAALIENRIPIAVPFIVAIGITWIKYGALAALGIFITIVLFALFKSINKDRCPLVKSAALLAISQIISSMLFIIVGKEFFVDFPRRLFVIVLSVLFVPAFTIGLKAILKFKEKDELNNSELVSLLVILMAMSSSFTHLSTYGMTLFSLVSIVSLMTVCWKKKIVNTLVFSVIACFIYLLVLGGSFQYVLLFLMVGLITALLSKAGKKGLLIGGVFALIYTIGFAPTEADIYNKLGMNESLTKDYAKFIEEQEEIKKLKASESGDFSVTAYAGYDMPTLVEEIKRMTYTPASTTIKEMLFGFALLMFLPIAFYRKYEYLTRNINSKTEFDFSKLFNNRKVLLLAEGKEEPKTAKEEEKPKKKVSNNNSKKKKKKK